MKNEIKSATDFLSNLLRSRNVPADTIESFRVGLQNLLCSHYANHWFPEKPFKGSGYRCIRINHKMDPLIKKAAVDSGLNESNFHTLFPSELTMWVDPREVAYRIGENGSIGMLYQSSLPHVLSQKHSDNQAQRERDAALEKQQQQFQQSSPIQADLELSTIGYSCKDQLMNVLPSYVTRENLKHIAAFV